MLKRSISIVLTVVFLMASSGCSYEVISRKFIRKKKKPKGPAALHHLTAYKKESNHTLYQNYYIYWKAWEDELVIYLSQIGHTKMRNSMKIAQCSKQALSNLKLMQFLKQLCQLRNHLKRTQLNRCFG